MQVYAGRLKESLYGDLDFRIFVGVLGQLDESFFGEEKGVDKFIPVLVNKAVKGFEPSRKWATKWFPDIELEESDK